MAGTLLGGGGMSRPRIRRETHTPRRTGETITFADRREIDAIVSQLQERNFGIRSILEAVVTSHIFMSK